MAVRVRDFRGKLRPVKLKVSVRAPEDWVRTDLWEQLWEEGISEDGWGVKIGAPSERKCWAIVNYMWPRMQGLLVHPLPDYILNHKRLRESDV